MGLQLAITYKINTNSFLNIKCYKESMFSEEFFKIEEISNILNGEELTVHDQVEEIVKIIKAAPSTLFNKHYYEMYTIINKNLRTETLEGKLKSIIQLLVFMGKKEHIVKLYRSHSSLLTPTDHRFLSVWASGGSLSDLRSIEKSSRFSRVVRGILKFLVLT